MPDAIRTHVGGKLVGEFCEAAFSIPPNYRVVSRILEEVLSIPPSASVRRNCADYPFNNGEFRALRQDGEYKVILSLSGQPRNGASVRKYAETPDRGNRNAA